MADFVSLTKVSDIPPGTKRSFFTSGKRIMVVNADGTFFAMDDMCSHAGCGLTEEGLVEGTSIICGCHGSKFDLADGSVLAPPATVPMKIYQVKVEGEQVLVAV